MRDSDISFNNLKKFILLDMKIKKAMVDDMRPPFDIDAYNEYSLIKYSDSAYKTLEYIIAELKIIAKNLDYKEFENRINYLTNVWITNFINCKNDREKLERFYSEYVTDMNENFVDKVKEECVGYSFNLPNNSIRMAKTINEMLHVMHSYIVNNEYIYQSLNKVEEKKLENGYSVKLYGQANNFSEKLFNLFPLDLDCGYIDIVSFGEINKVMMMIRDRGHALTIEIDENEKNNSEKDFKVSYFIPKLCNIEMIKMLPGINRIKDDASMFSGATGKFFCDIDSIYTNLFQFISMVPTDEDMIKYSK